MTQDAETQYLHRVTMETNEHFFLRIALLTEPGIQSHLCSHASLDKHYLLGVPNKQRDHLFFWDTNKILGISITLLLERKIKDLPTNGDVFHQANYREAL